MSAEIQDWERLVRRAERNALDGESAKVADLLKVAAEIRAMRIGLRQVAVAESNAGGMRVVMQATTQNAHTVSRAPTAGDPNGRVPAARDRRRNVAPARRRAGQAVLDSGGAHGRPCAAHRGQPRPARDFRCVG
jgi:hypothetical protein